MSVTPMFPQLTSGRSRKHAQATQLFEVGVQFIVEQIPHIRTFWDTNSHLKKGNGYIQVSRRANKKGNFEVRIRLERSAACAARG